MVDVNQFGVELEASIERMNDFALEMVKQNLDIAYSYIMAEWPAHTYYSMANNFVSMNKPVTSPQPDERPTRKGEMVEEASIIFQLGTEVIEKIKSKKRGEIVVYISNPVDYAEDVGFTAGLGATIYEMATVHAEAETQFSEEFML